MQLIIILLVIFFIYTIISDDCIINCESVIRDKSVDLAKIEEFLGPPKKEDSNAKYYCIKKDSKLITVYVRDIKDDINGKNMLAISTVAYDPPDIGETAWKRGTIPLVFIAGLEKTLNFGVTGILKEISEDKRCRGGFFVLNFELLKKLENLGVSLDDYLDDYKEYKNSHIGHIVVCNYSKNAILPISESTLKAESEFGLGYEFCK